MIVLSTPDNPVQGLVPPRDQITIAAPREARNGSSELAENASFTGVFRAMLTGSEIERARAITPVDPPPAENAEGESERPSDSEPSPEDTRSDTLGPDAQTGTDRDQPLLADDLAWEEIEPIVPTHSAVPANSGVSAPDHPDADMAWATSVQIPVAQAKVLIPMPILASMQMPQTMSASMADPIPQGDQPAVTPFIANGLVRPPFYPPGNEGPGSTSTAWSVGSTGLPVGNLPYNNTDLRDAGFGGSRSQIREEAMRPFAVADGPPAQGIRVDGVGPAQLRKADLMQAGRDNDIPPSMRTQTTPAPMPRTDIYTFSTSAADTERTAKTVPGSSVPITLASATLPPLQSFLQSLEALPLQPMPGVSGSANPPAGGFVGGQPVAHVAASIAAQIAVAVSGDRTGSTDIRLSPQELGRVRLSLVTHDSAIAVAIFAERPETAELMRRHIDILAQEFRAMGFDDVTFSFADERSGRRDQAQNEKMADGARSATPVADEIVVENLKPAGLDLRL